MTDLQSLRRDFRDLQLPLSALSLDPADRAVLRIADERDAVQKKTFTNWINKHLSRATLRVQDLFEDLRDGRKLITLIEILSGDGLPRERGSTRIHRMQNVQVVLDYLQTRRGLKIVNIRSDEIVDGNPKLTLGLVWIIILHFQVTDIVHTKDDTEARDALIEWCSRQVLTYGLRVTDLTTSFRDGRVFLAILHSYRPQLFDWRVAHEQSARQNLTMAFELAEKEFGVSQILDATDIDVLEPDERCVMTYVSMLYDILPRAAAAGSSRQDVLTESERLIRIDEYSRVAQPLVKWLTRACEIMQDRAFPTAMPQLNTVRQQLSRFRDEDALVRERDKQRLFRLYDDLVKHSSVEYANTRIEEALRPDEVKRLWERFIALLNERTLALQTHINAQERLDRVADRVALECAAVEQQLNKTELEIVQRDRFLSDLNASQQRVSRNSPTLDYSTAGTELLALLRPIEESLKEIEGKVTHLVDGRHYNALPLQRRLQKLQRRADDARKRIVKKFLNGVLVEPTQSQSQNPAAAARPPRPRTSASSPTRSQRDDTQPLLNLLNWIASKRAELNGVRINEHQLAAIQSVRQKLEVLDNGAAQVLPELERCVAARSRVAAENLAAFDELHDRVQNELNALQRDAQRRLKDIDTLLPFAKLATQELLWLADQQETLLQRSLSATTAASTDLLQTADQLNLLYTKLMEDLERRQAQFTQILDDGETQIRNGHSELPTVEYFVGSLQAQWNWLLQFRSCIDAQMSVIRDTSAFYADCGRIDAWLAQESEQLASHFTVPIGRVDQSQLSIEQCESLLRELADLHVSLSNEQEKLAKLRLRAEQLAPIRLDCPTAEFSLLPVRAVCDYRTKRCSVRAHEPLNLLDSVSSPLRCVVRTAAGLELQMPAICIRHSPPNAEALRRVDRLVQLVEELLARGKSTEQALTQRRTLAWLRHVQQWTPHQFDELNAARRDEIIRAVNANCDLLANELQIQLADKTEPETQAERARLLSTLQQELRDCNDHYESLAKQHQNASSSVTPRVTLTSVESSRVSIENGSIQMPPSVNGDAEVLDAASVISNRLQLLLERFAELERELDEAVGAKLEPDLDVLERSMNAHSEFEQRLQTYDDEVAYLRHACDLQPDIATDSVESLRSMRDTYSRLWRKSRAFVERLRTHELYLSQVDNVLQTLIDAEKSLVDQPVLPSRSGELTQFSTSLRQIADDVEEAQNEAQQLASLIEALREATEDSRKELATACDTRPEIRDLELASHRLAERCATCLDQVVSRLAVCEAALAAIDEYRSNRRLFDQWIASALLRLVDASADQRDALLLETQAKQPDVEALKASAARYLDEHDRFDRLLVAFRGLPCDAANPCSTVRDAFVREVEQGSQAYSDLLDALSKVAPVKPALDARAVITENNHEILVQSTNFDYEQRTTDQTDLAVQPTSLKTATVHESRPLSAIFETLDESLLPDLSLRGMSFVTERCAALRVTAAQSSKVTVSQPFVSFFSPRTSSACVSEAAEEAILSQPLSASLSLAPLVSVSVSEAASAPCVRFAQSLCDELPHESVDRVLSQPQALALQSSVEAADDHVMVSTASVAMLLAADVVPRVQPLAVCESLPAPTVYIAAPRQEDPRSRSASLYETRTEHSDSTSSFATVVDFVVGKTRSFETASQDYFSCAPTRADSLASWHTARACRAECDGHDQVRYDSATSLDALQGPMDSQDDPDLTLTDDLAQQIDEQWLSVAAVFNDAASCGLTELRAQSYLRHDTNSLHKLPEDVKTGSVHRAAEQENQEPQGLVKSVATEEFMSETPVVSVQRVLVSESPKFGQSDRTAGHPRHAEVLEEKQIGTEPAEKLPSQMSRSRASSCSSVTSTSEEEAIEQQTLSVDSHSEVQPKAVDSSPLSESSNSQWRSEDTMHDAVNQLPVADDSESSAAQDVEEQVSKKPRGKTFKETPASATAAAKVPEAGPENVEQSIDGSQKPEPVETQLASKDIARPLAVTQIESKSPKSSTSSSSSASSIVGDVTDADLVPATTSHDPKHLEISSPESCVEPARFDENSEVSKASMGSELESSRAARFDAVDSAKADVEDDKQRHETVQSEDRNESSNKVPIEKLPSGDNETETSSAVCKPVGALMETGEIGPKSVVNDSDEDTSEHLASRKSSSSSSSSSSLSRTSAVLDDSGNGAGIVEQDFVVPASNSQSTNLSPSGFSPSVEPAKRKDSSEVEEPRKMKSKWESVEAVMHDGASQVPMTDARAQSYTRHDTERTVEYDEKASKKPRSKTFKETPARAVAAGKVPEAGTESIEPSIDRSQDPESVETQLTSKDVTRTPSKSPRSSTSSSSSASSIVDAVADADLHQKSEETTSATTSQDPKHLEISSPESCVEPARFDESAEVSKPSTGSELQSAGAASFDAVDSAKADVEDRNESSNKVPIEKLPSGDNETVRAPIETSELGSKSVVNDCSVEPAKPKDGSGLEEPMKSKWESVEAVMHDGTSQVPMTDARAQSYTRHDTERTVEYDEKASKKPRSKTFKETPARAPAKEAGAENVGQLIDGSQVPIGAQLVSDVKAEQLLSRKSVADDVELDAAAAARMKEAARVVECSTLEKTGGENETQSFGETSPLTAPGIVAPATESEIRTVASSLGTSPFERPSDDAPLVSSPEELASSDPNQLLKVQDSLSLATDNLEELSDSCSPVDRFVASESFAAISVSCHSAVSDSVFEPSCAAVPLSSLPFSQSVPSHLSVVQQDSFLNTTGSRELPCHLPVSIIAPTSLSCVSAKPESASRTGVAQSPEASEASNTTSGVCVDSRRSSFVADPSSADQRKLMVQEAESLRALCEATLKTLAECGDEVANAKTESAITAAVGRARAVEHDCALKRALFTQALASRPVNEEVAPLLAVIDARGSEIEDAAKGLLADAQLAYGRLAKLDAARDELVVMKDVQLWLAQKAKVLNALGPIAAVPLLITTQLQQLAIIDDELQPQKARVQALADHFDSIRNLEPPKNAQLAEFDALQRDFDAFCGALGDKQKELRAVEPLCSELHAALAQVSNKLESARATLSDIDRVPQSATKQSCVLSQLASSLRGLADGELRSAGSACDALCALLDTQAQADVRGKLQSEERRVLELEDVVDRRAADLGRWLRQLEDLHEQRDALKQQVELLELSRSDSRAQDASCFPQKLLDALTELRAVSMQVADMDADCTRIESEYEQLLPLCLPITDTDAEAERRGIASTFEAIRDALARIRDANGVDEKQLTELLQYSSRFFERAERIRLWCQLEAERLADVQLDAADSSVELSPAQRLRELRRILSELGRKLSEFNELEQAGQELLTRASQDHGAVNDVLEDLATKLRSLYADAERALALVEQQAAKVDEITSDLTELESNLRELENDFAAISQLRPRCDQAPLAKLRAIQSDLRELEEQRNELLSALRDLDKDDEKSASKVSLIDDPTRQRVAKVERDMQAFKTALDDEVAARESAVQLADRVGTAIATLNARCAERRAEAGLDRVALMSLECDTIDDKLQLCKAAIEKLRPDRQSAQSMEAELSSLVQSGVMAHDDARVFAYEQLAGNLERTEADLARRIDELGRLLSGLSDLETYVEETHKKLDGTRVEFDQLAARCTSTCDLTNVSDVNALKDEFSALRRSGLTPVQTQLADCEITYKHLVQSEAVAMPTSSEQHEQMTPIERKMTQLHDAFNTLLADFANKEQLLDAALIKVGELNSLLQANQLWLSNMEETLDSQQPISYDLLLTRSQLNESRLIAQLIAERETIVAQTSELARSVGSRLSKSDADAVAAQVAAIASQFASVKQRNAQRTAALETCRPLAQRFRDLLDPLRVWLDAAEKRLASLDDSAASANRLDPAAVANTLGAYRHLADEAAEQHDVLQRVFSAAEPLKQAIDAEFHPQLVREVDLERLRLDRLLDAARIKSQTVEVAFDELESTPSVEPADLQSFFDDAARLESWLSGTDLDVQSTEPDSGEPAQLHDALDKLMKLKEEVAARDADLAALDAAGKQWLGAGAEDETLVARTLAAVRQQRDELAERCDLKISNCRDALPLAERLNAAHKRIGCWLAEAQPVAEALTVRPAAVPVDQVTQLINAASATEPAVSELELCAEQLKQLVPATAAEPIESLVKRDVENFVHTRRRLLTSGSSRKVSDSNSRSRFATAVSGVSKTSSGSAETLYDSLDQSRTSFTSNQPQQNAVGESSPTAYGRTRRSAAVTNEMQNELSYWAEFDKNLLERLVLPSEADALDTALENERALATELAVRKDKLKDLRRELARQSREQLCSADSLQALHRTFDELRFHADTVVRCIGDRVASLEQAATLVHEFDAAETELNSRFDDLERAADAKTSVDPNANGNPNASPNSYALRDALFEARRLERSLGDTRPRLDQLNKLGAALVQLYEAQPNDCASIAERLEIANGRFGNLRSAAHTRNANAEQLFARNNLICEQLEAAHDAVAALADAVRLAERTSAQPDKLREHLADCSNTLDELERRSEALQRLADQARDAEKLAMTAEDQAEFQRNVQQAEELLDDCAQLQASVTRQKERLDEALELAESFWDEHNALQAAIDDVREAVRSADVPSCDSRAITEQIDDTSKMSDDIEALQGDIEQLAIKTGRLTALIDEPDSVSVRRLFDDLVEQLAQLVDEHASRRALLEGQAFSAAAHTDSVVLMSAFLDAVEQTLIDRFYSPQVDDVDAVLRQLEEIKLVRRQIEDQQQEIDRLNELEQQLAAHATEETRGALQQDTDMVNERWVRVLREVNAKKNELQLALLHLGDFERSTDDLIGWLDNTDSALDDLYIARADPKALELEASKLDLIQADIDAHNTAIESVNQLLGLAAGGNGKLADLNEKWQALAAKAALKHTQLDAAIQESRAALHDLLEMQATIADFENRLLAVPVLGGLPETTQAQLVKLQQLDAELDAAEPRCRAAVQNARELVGASAFQSPAMSPRSTASSFHTDHSKSSGKFARISKQLGAIDRNWNNLRGKLNNRKAKQTEQCERAAQFSSRLQDLIRWLTEVEPRVSPARPVSRIVDVARAELAEVLALRQDIQAKGLDVLSLDSLRAEMLKDSVKKQDVVIIRNLYQEANDRFNRLTTRTNDRVRKLETACRDAQQFADQFANLQSQLAALRVELDNCPSISATPDGIRAQIAKHKQFQRVLGAKQLEVDAVRRLGRALKEKGTQPAERNQIQAMLDDMKTEWTDLCTRSVERQRELEKALLATGQYREVMAGLLDWLHSVEPKLLDGLTENGEPRALAGDVDTVQTLSDQQKVIRKELESRRDQVAFVRKAAKEIFARSENYSETMQDQLVELSATWERVNRVCEAREKALAACQKQAAEFHSLAGRMMEEYARIDKTLQQVSLSLAADDAQQTALDTSDEESHLLRQLQEVKSVQHTLASTISTHDAAIRQAHEILKRAHPDAVAAVRTWLNVLKTRRDELSVWSEERGEQLAAAIETLHRNEQLLDELLVWLRSTQLTLSHAKELQLPDTVEDLHGLIEAHEQHVNELLLRQPDYTALIKSAKRFRGPAVTPRFYHRSVPQSGPQFRNPQIEKLDHDWRKVWLNTFELRQKFQQALDDLNEMERIKNFDYNEWKGRYRDWVHTHRSRVIGTFRRADKTNSGRIPRHVFVDTILHSQRRTIPPLAVRTRVRGPHGCYYTYRRMQPFRYFEDRFQPRFPTSRIEMEAVANVFDPRNEGIVDYKQFLASLRTDRETAAPVAEKPVEVALIQDEMKKQVSKCSCCNKFMIDQVGSGKYRFGEAQKLRLVRILRSTVMVRVGGGWMSLEEFLVKNDPCRAKGRTNFELREKFMLPQGVSQTMTPFRKKQGSETSTAADSLEQLSDRTPLSFAETPRRLAPVRPDPHHHSSSASEHNSIGSARSISSRVVDTVPKVTPAVQVAATQLGIPTNPISKVRVKTVHDSPWRAGAAKQSAQPLGSGSTEQSRNVRASKLPQTPSSSLRQRGSFKRPSVPVGRTPVTPKQDDDPGVVRRRNTLGRDALKSAEDLGRRASLYEPNDRSSWMATSTIDISDTPRKSGSKMRLISNSATNVAEEAAAESAARRTPLRGKVKREDMAVVLQPTPPARSRPYVSGIPKPK